MKTNKQSKFPKDFFKKIRPEVSIKESLKDVIPVEWKGNKSFEKSTASSKLVKFK